MSGGGPDPPPPAAAIDGAVAVRPGEEIDLARLATYLREALPGLDGEPRLRQFPAGFSNLTYLVAFDDTELVVRRPPFGRKPRTGHDMGREHAVLSALGSVRERFPYAPRPLLLCDDESILGCPFLVMERLTGIVLRRDPPPGLELPAETVARICRELVDVQVELHALDWRALGLERLGRPEGYAARQVRGWSERYRRARTPDVPDFEETMAWLAGRLPPAAGRAALIHNDFKLDNVVLEPGSLAIAGVLDWEMATVGDPLMDLGASLAYWVERGDPPALRATRMLPTTLGGAPTRAEIVERYLERSGLACDDFGFYRVFGLFRLAAIAQQIYYRYHHGQSRDPRFRALAEAVRALDAAARDETSSAARS